MWPYRCAYDNSTGDTDSKYIWVCKSNSKSLFLAKVTFLECRRGCGHIDVLMKFPWLH